MSNVQFNLIMVYKKREGSSACIYEEGTSDVRDDELLETASTPIFKRLERIEGAANLSQMANRHRNVQSDLRCSGSAGITTAK